ncbi:MAG: sugar ABC transporter substrate-binding protein [Candidatus Riflebacteria bacterium]|nr:sugar ABC transporter substrate-binding protein [Candidatus Riflebacteria bacterium]
MTSASGTPRTTTRRAGPAFLGALAVLLSLPIVGCDGEPGGPPRLRFATWFGTREAAEMAPIVAAINARNAGRFVLEMITIPDAYLTKIDTMMAGGLAPDLFLLSAEYLVSYASVGAIADLDDRIRRDPTIDLADFYPSAISASTCRGRLHSLPWVMMPIVLYFNKDLFDQAREPYPDATWDWARFAVAARALTKRDGSGRAARWGFVQHTWPPYLIWVWQNGGDVLSADGKRPTLTDPRTVEALSFLDRLVNVDGVTPSAGTVSQLGVNELFKSGRIAMFFGGSSDDHDRTPGLRVGVAELPKGRVRATFAWMGHLVVSSRTRHPDLAYVAWRELLEGFHRWKIVAPRRSLARQLERFEPRKAAARSVILASMDYSRPVRGVVEQTDWDGFVLEKLLLPVLRGEERADRAAAVTQRKLERILETTR